MIIVSRGYETTNRSCVVRTTEEEVFRFIAFNLSRELCKRYDCFLYYLNRVSFQLCYRSVSILQY